MGENVLRGQVKSFKKGKDLSLIEMTAPTLFDREDIVTTSYTGQPANGFVDAPGNQLEAHPMPDGQTIKLAKGHQVVGAIIGDGAASLLEAMNDANRPQSITMQIKEVSAISGFMKLEIVKGNKPDGN